MCSWAQVKGHCFCPFNTGLCQATFNSLPQYGVGVFPILSSCQPIPSEASQWGTLLSMPTVGVVLTAISLWSLTS